MRLIHLIILIITLSACGGTSLEDSTATSEDNQNTAQYTQLEGDSTNSLTTLQFIADFTGTLSYQTFNIDAVDKSDYLAINGTIDVITGQSYELFVEVIPDQRIENDEKFGIRISKPELENWLTIFIIIENDDFPGISITPIDATEGDIGSTKLQYLIQLSESVKAALSISIQTVAMDELGYGLSNIDYIPLATDVVFLEGELEKSIDVEILSDFDIEPDEKVVLRANYLDDQSITATAIIRSDDFPGMGAPTFIINAGRSMQVAENTSKQIFTVPIAIDEGTDFSESFVLNYKLREISSAFDNSQNDKALAGEDFTENLNQIQILPGKNSYQAAFTIIDDDQLEKVEILELVLFNDAGVEFGVGRIYVADNEAPSFKLYRTYTDSAGQEVVTGALEYLESSNDLGVHKVYVELEGIAGYDYQLDYIVRLANSGEAASALDAEDWEQDINGSVVQSKRLTFVKGNSLPNGIDAEGIAFTVNSDDEVEAHESFFIELKDVTGNSISQPIEVTILNDDLPDIQWVNPTLSPPATNNQPYKVYEGNELALELQLIGSHGLGSIALENFNLSMSVETTEGEACSWRQSSSLSDSEFSVANLDESYFIFSQVAVPVTLHSLEDDLTECDESLNLVAVLKSQISSVTSTRRTVIKVEVVNDDKATLDVYGFTTTETEGQADFKVQLNSDIAIDVEFDLVHVTTEAEDGEFQTNSTPVNFGINEKQLLQFNESTGQRIQLISGIINDDEMVELDEEYRLDVYLKNSEDSLPIIIRQCSTSEADSCIVSGAASLAATVTGTLLNDDKVTLTLLAKNNHIQNEVNLTELSLLDNDIEKPYFIQLNKSIASDVPEIILSLSDRCLLITDNECATSSDYQIPSTTIHSGATETRNEEIDLNFNLLAGDSIVEPDEVAKLLLALNDPELLSTFIDGWTNQQINFTIVDDDKLNFSINPPTASPLIPQYSEGASDSKHNTGYVITWDKEIASNVSVISFNLSESCDNTLNDHCIASVVISDSTLGDVEFSNELTIHDGITNTPANFLGKDAGIFIIGDDIVEPEESGKVLFSINNALETEAYLDTIAWREREVEFSIENDDEIVVSLTASSTNISEGNIGVIDAGLVLSWDKEIAENVADIHFNITESCDNSLNPHCVSDIINQDFNIQSNIVSLHSKNTVTLGGGSKSLGVTLIGDLLIEPNEILKIDFTLVDPASSAAYFSPPWSDKSQTITIDNDDKLTPILSFRDDPNIASGAEDTDNNLIAGNDVGLKLTWGGVDIADNVDDLIFEIVGSCLDCGLDGSDYSLEEGSVTLSSLTSNGTLNYEFKITSDGVVEPNETVMVNLKINASTPDHYFSSIPATGVFSSLEYLITNDDKLTIDVMAANTSLTEGDTGSQDVGFSLSWDKDIAENVDDIQFNLIDNCDNGINSHCVSDIINKDIILQLTTIHLHTKNTYTNANSDKSLEVKLVGDLVVEPNEIIDLKLSLISPLNLTDYFSTVWVDKNITTTINNDDTLIPILSFLDEPNITTGAEDTDKDLSAGNDVGLLLSWGGVEIADNTDNLIFEIIDTCIDCGLISDDYTIASGDLILTSLAISGSLPYEFKLTADDVVEPNETVSIEFKKKSTTPDHYFQTIPASNLFSLLEYTISNDDRLTVSLSTNAAVIEESNAGTKDAGFVLTWDKAVADNVGSIQFSITESCDNTADPHCVSDVLNDDFSISSNTINLHSENSTTNNNGSTDLGVQIVGDLIVEPNERLNIQLSLINPAASTDYFATAWLDRVKEITVTNDDKILPTLSFKDDPDIANGSEDIDKDLSPGNDVGLILSWGATTVADNVDDLNFEIIDDCMNCGVGDYTITSGSIPLSSLVANNSLEYEFKINSDLMVEPNEIVNIKFKQSATTPDHYFSSIPTDGVFSELEYTINNDERIIIKTVRTDGLTSTDLPESQVSPLSLSWLGHVASNVPELTLMQEELCDNDDSDATFSKCLAQTSSLNNSPADISISSSSTIKTSGLELDASVSAEIVALELTQNNDAWVEIDEHLSLKFVIPEAMKTYVRFDTPSSSESTPVFEIINDYQLINDDSLTVNLGNTTVSGNIANESDEASISHLLELDKNVEQDVPDLTLDFIVPSTAGIVYANQSVSFTNEDDYRVFLDTLTEEGLVSTTINIKPLGESLLVSSKELIIKVGDDEIVEQDEIVAFQLKENNPLINLLDSNVAVADNVLTTERDFVIPIEDKIQLSFLFTDDPGNPENTNHAEADTDLAIATIISGLKEIDQNIGNLTIQASIACKAMIPLTCSNSEASINASTILDPNTITSASNIDLGFQLTGDQIVEPDEVVIISLSVADKTEYFDLSGLLSRDFAILNDDLLTVSMTSNAASIVEGDLLDTASTISLTITDEGEGIEGIQSINYTIDQNTIAGFDNAEPAGGNKDFELAGSIGNRIIDLTNIQSPLSGSITHTLASIEPDHHIEADEVLSLAVNLTLDSHYSSLGDNPSITKEYIITDDDYLSTVMRDLPGQFEQSPSFDLLICDKQGGGIESDLILDLAITSVFLDASLNEILADDKKATIIEDFSLTSGQLAITTNEINNSNTYLTHECAVKSLPITIVSDTEIELNEWYGLAISSTEPYWCSAANNNCLEQNLVILNDDSVDILDSGTQQCITSAGSLAALSTGNCTELSLQDTEVDYPNNEYSYINSQGAPLLTQMQGGNEVAPSNYDCISDNYSGLIWSSARLPFDGTHSLDGKSWSGSILENTSTFENLFVADGFCDYPVATRKWQLPSVEQLLGVANYEELEADGNFTAGVFKNEEIVNQSLYWSRDACDSDANSSTKEYWVVNFKTGAVNCRGIADQYLIRAVYY